MFRSYHHHQGAYNLSLLKLGLLKQSINLRRCGYSSGVAAYVIKILLVCVCCTVWNLNLVTYAATPPE
jgi:hypothetical protein